MKNTKILEMINEGRIEELKELLRDEIYADSLNNKTNARKRYLAMKKYFKYHTSAREVLQKPCVVEFENREYISFCNSWSLAMTKESCGEIELFDDPERYPNVTKLIRFDGIKKKINFRNVIAEAKSLGYKLTKSEVDSRFNYLMLYDDTYYKVGLIDATFGIIDDGKEAMTYHPYGERMPLTIMNDLGLCIIMPVKYDYGVKPEDTGKIIIEVK